MFARRGLPQLYTLTRYDTLASNTIVASTLQVSSFDAYVLFNPGSIHSYVSLFFTSRFGKLPVMLDHPFRVRISME